MSSKKKVLIAALLIIVIICLLIGCVNRPKPVEQPSVNVQDTVGAKSTDLVEFEKLEKYVGTKYGFSLQYPATWNFKDMTADSKGLIFSKGNVDQPFANMSLMILPDQNNSDYFKDYKEIKKDYAVNWTGNHFDLTYYVAKADAARVESNENVFVQVKIENKLLPGTTIFTYGTQLNPNGDAVMRKFLELILPV